MNDKDKAALEASWNHEHKLRIQSEADAASLRAENLALRHQVANAESEVIQIRGHLDAIKELLAKADLQRQDAVEKEQRVLQQLKRLRTDLGELEFWRTQFAEVLEAERLEMEALAQPINRPPNQEVEPHDLMLAWATHIGEGLRPPTEPDFVNLRRYVLAQWVYLRWLEIHAQVSHESQ